MVEVLRERVAGGDYEIDTRAVAEAILTRRRESDPLQTLCSEMLVALKLPARPAHETEPLTGDDSP